MPEAKASQGAETMSQPNIVAKQAYGYVCIDVKVDNLKLASEFNRFLRNPEPLREGWGRRRFESCQHSRILWHNGRRV